MGRGRDRVEMALQRKEPLAWALERCRVFFWIKRWVRPVSLPFPAWEQLKCPPTEEWIKKIQHMYMMDYLLMFSHSVVSDSLWPHGLQHTRLPWPSPSPGVCSNSCPLSWWCHPNISSSFIPFSTSLQSFPASESFPMSQLFISGTTQP